MSNVQPETSLPTALNTDDVPDAILARWEDADADQSSDDGEEASQPVEQEETIDEVDLTEIDETEEDTEDDETELEQDETDTEDTDEDSDEDGEDELPDYCEVGEVKDLGGRRKCGQEEYDTGIT